MSRQSLVICGLTPYAAMVAHYFETCSAYEVVAFTAHQRLVTAAEFQGRPVVPIQELSKRVAADTTSFYAAIEYKWLNAARAQVVAELKSLGYRPASFIHPRSHVCPTVRLGEHNLVMEAVVLSHGSELGSNNVLFPQTFVGHAARIGSHNYFCPGVLVERSARVQDHCFLGAGTFVAGSASVGHWCYTRARQEVLEPLADGTTFNPSLRAPGRVIDRRRPATPSSTLSE
jgi:UDP-3-O-[3-hydroxymyristoyl] glucosamine N-acyltransferase